MRNRGVTLVSLSIYIIVAVMIVGALAFINVNFMTRTGELSKRTKIINEYTKFCSFFIEDVKTNETILDYTSEEIRFPNGRKYTIKKAGESFDIYVNSIKICEDLIEAGFDYSLEQNSLFVSFKFSNGKNIISNNQSYLVGRGYWFGDVNYELEGEHRC